MHNSYDLALKMYKARSSITINETIWKMLSTIDRLLFTKLNVYFDYLLCHIVQPSINDSLILNWNIKFIQSNWELRINFLILFLLCIFFICSQ